MRCSDFNDLHSVINMSFCPKAALNKIFGVFVPLCTQVLSHVWLCNPMDCSLPGSSVCGIFQARILEWVSIFYFRRSTQPRYWICVSCNSWQLCLLSLSHLGSPENSSITVPRYGISENPEESLLFNCEYLWELPFVKFFFYWFSEWNIFGFKCKNVYTQRWMVLAKKSSHLFTRTLTIFLFLFRLPWWLSKESACNAGDLGLIPELGRYPGGGHGNPLQYPCLENPQGQRNLAGYSPWGRKESDTTERLSTFSSLSLQILFFLHPSSLYAYSNVF